MTLALRRRRLFDAIGRRGILGIAPKLIELHPSVTLISYKQCDSD
jgi:hypothetical protein